MELLRWHGSVGGVVEECTHVGILRAAAAEDVAGVVGFLGQCS